MAGLIAGGRAEGAVLRGFPAHNREAQSGPRRGRSPAPFTLAGPEADLGRLLAFPVALAATLLGKVWIPLLSSLHREDVLPREQDTGLRRE